MKYGNHCALRQELEVKVAAERVSRSQCAGHQAFAALRVAQRDKADVGHFPFARVADGDGRHVVTAMGDPQHAAGQIVEKVTDQAGTAHCQDRNDR